MTFTIECPNCQKRYTAEPKWIGKSFRCKKCETAFIVEQPVESAATKQLVTALPARRRRPDFPPAEPSLPPAEEQNDPLHDLGNLASRQRARDLKASAGRERIEGHLRRMLLILALALAAIVTLKRNTSGIAGFTYLRIGVAALLFLMLVLPVTYQSFASYFRRARVKLPPGPASRVAGTFAIPASLGYAAWQINGSPVGFLVGLLIALPVMLFVFWFEFRAKFGASLTAYVRACIGFLIGSSMAAGALAGVNLVVNQALLNAHATSYAESPLGGALFWRTPTDAPVIAAEDRSEKSTSHPRTVVPPTRSPGLFGLTAAGISPSDAPAPHVPSRSGNRLFVNPDDDQYVADLEKYSHPWVKQISRPEGQYPFDFILAPSIAAPCVGFVSLDKAAAANRRFAAGMAINARIQRAKTFDVLQDGNPHAFVREFFLSNDGTLLIHLKDATIELISTATHRHDSFALTIPDNARLDNLSPQIAGLTRDQTIVVRWSAPSAVNQIVQRYSYATRALIGTRDIDDARPAGESSAVATVSSGPLWMAQVVTPFHRPPSLCIVDLENSRAAPTTTPVPNALDMSDYEAIELAFSPDGNQIALLLTDRSQAAVYIWNSSNVTASPLELVTPMLTPALASSHVAGPRVRWIDDEALLIDGQTVISAAAGHPGIVGSLSENAALGATTIAPDDVLLSYLGADGSCHLAEIEFDPTELHQAAPLK